ncbi:hypothetical protein Hypma_008876, partial [Hypsizygus marmoreus]
MSAPLQAALLKAISILDDTNWSDWSTSMRMYLKAMKVKGIMDDYVPPAAELKAWNEKDEEMLPVMYITVHADYRYLLEGLDSGKAACQKLKAHFNCSTMRHHITACADLYGIIHDPELPIDKYIQSLTAVQKKLKDLECTIDNLKFINVLLMHLDSSFHPVHTYILAQKTEPDLETVPDMPLHTSDLHPIPIDEKSDPFMDGGFKWGDVNSDGCHCCGRTGHIASRCFIKMPQRIINHILKSRSCSPPHCSVTNQANLAEGTSRASMMSACISTFPHYSSPY